MKTKHYALTKDKYLTDSEQEYLLNLLTTFPSRDSLLVELALNTGARKSELLAITKADLNGEDQTVYIRGLKGSDDRAIPLRYELFKRIIAFCDGTPEQQRLFDVSTSRVQQIWDSYRVNDKPFHSLRHTFAINLYKKCRDLRVVQIALGHRNIANTMIYSQYVFKSEELRRAMQV